MEPMESFLVPSRSRVYINNSQHINNASGRWERERMKEETNRAGLVLAALQDLDKAFIVLGGTELILQSILAGAVENALGAVADGDKNVSPYHQQETMTDLPMSYKYLPPVEHISQWDAAVTFPLLQDPQVINEDNKVLRATLVKDLVGGIVGARHFESSEMIVEFNWM